MRMLRWICGKTLKDRIRNEHIREMVGVAPIEDKMRENRLRWFGHIQRKPLDAPVRKSDLLTIHGNARGRGRPKPTWIEIIKKDITSCNLSVSLALDRSEWSKQIHVANPMQLGRGLDELSGVDANRNGCGSEIDMNLPRLSKI